MTTSTTGFLSRVAAIAVFVTGVGTTGPSSSSPSLLELSPSLDSLAPPVVAPAGVISHPPSA